MEEEFIQNQEQHKPQEEKAQVRWRGNGRGLRLVMLTKLFDE